MKADFDFAFPHDEYCKCGGGECNGESRTHPYNESWNTSEKIITLLNSIEISSEDGTPESNKKWIDFLKEEMYDELIEVLLEVIKDGIDPFMVMSNKYGWYKVKNSLRAKMNNSLNKIKQKNETIFPDKFFSEIKDIDHYDIISEILEKYNTSWYDIITYDCFIPSYPDNDETLNNTCEKCGTCFHCKIYNENIRKAIRTIADSYCENGRKISFYPSISTAINRYTLSKINAPKKSRLFGIGARYSWCTYLVRDISLKIIDTIKLNFNLLNTEEFSWVKNLPGEVDLLSQEIQEDNILSYYDVIYDYVTVTLMYIKKQIDSERYKNKSTSEFKKAGMVKQLFNYRDTHRLLPLYRITNAYEEELLEGRMNSLDAVKDLILVGADRIFGQSIIIEDILRDHSDPLLPLWEEMNYCLSNDKFFITQSCIANILGLVRDNRCISQIKHISSDIDRESFIESFSTLVDILGVHAETASVFILPFIKTSKLPFSNRSTSLNRNGTVHGGIEYFSKFNALGMLLLLTSVFIEMYAFDESDPDSIHPMFRPKNEWSG